ncbi:deoxyribodipyrimidine photo-lyase [Cypionkella aquatica]|uniref:Deoxyribodipyrimidine photo-lyase n=1 Tax=Cypionkella aquatica TaxID=1756042 RepID=A0AA37TZ17_9RHOB|nr:FAD-binding domain-containing protein [Cypionkella aquatica]GLS88035.1 deoxyribodipyrimidine photo-lyase [Cypionkella aquatica]
MNVLIWFKRDLRAHDHPALTLAAGLGAVLPLYIVEPDYWALPDTSARQWAFTAECLEDLRTQLAGIGAPLLVRVGEAQAVLQRLCQQHNITRIVSHQETGNAFSYARDRRIAAWANASGIMWDEVPQSNVVRGPSRRNPPDPFNAAPQLDPPALNALPGLAPGLIPTARALRLSEDKCAHRQHGGRAQGVALLQSFLTQRGAPYRLANASPLTAERACSRLSPHLANGSLSLREVTQATQSRAAEHPGGLWPGAIASFQTRLTARDAALQSLEDTPSYETRCLHPAAELLRRNSDAARLSAWAQGETGLPFIDACLRYLAATGWLNFRARAAVIACASYHLWLDWRVTGALLARRLTDYEPGIHWPQVQLQSGTTGLNTPRIYNPVKQGLDQDPTGAFTRRWLPELSNVPDAYLQAPWRWSGAGSVLGRRYPEPIVDITTAQREAREAVCRISRKPTPRPARPERVEMIERASAHAPKRSQPKHGQLSLDLP